MPMRKLVLAVILLGAAPAAHADVGLGLFLGRPTGFDAKLGLDARSGLDIVVGWDYYDNRSDYAHLTYLLTPVVSQGRSVIVPLRFGIGVAIFDDYYYFHRFGDHFGMAVRVPAELGVRFRSVPLEIYGEIALRVNLFFDDVYYDRVELDGGIGFRIYF